MTMLDPGNRALLLESLRPPVGYRLDRAIGTTYSLDLLALLTAPLAFTFFDWEDKDGRPTADPVALLESVRRHAGRIHLFCQAGEIKLPPPSQRLVAYLERMVIPVCAPTDRKGRRGLFHPKVWLLRYLAGNKPAKYRLICATRNLTFDRSWDILLSIDGELQDRSNAISASKPIGEFVSSLLDLAVYPFDPAARSAIAHMADEVTRVRFELPEHVEEVVFWPLGLPGSRRYPFQHDRRRRPLLIMSPFVSSDMLSRLIKDRGGNGILISRPEELLNLPPEIVRSFKQVFSFRSDANDQEEVRDDTERSTLAGLHAKLFVEDDGWYSRIYVGSANATVAAFDRNVEFLVELKGKKKDFGIEALLGKEQSKDGMHRLLEPWEPRVHVISPEELIANALDDELARIRRSIAVLPLSLHCICEPQVPDRFIVELRTASRLDECLRDSWSCWLATLHDTAHLKVDRTEDVLAKFGPLDQSSLTAFLACKISISRENVTRSSQFVLILPIHGLPTERLDRLLASQISDSGRLLQLLVLLLQPDGSATALAEATERGNGEAGVRDEGWSGAPLFEVLVRATADGTERIAEMGRLLDDLMRTNQGRALIPDTLLELWNQVSDTLGVRR